MVLKTIYFQYFDKITEMVRIRLGEDGLVYRRNKYVAMCSTATLYHLVASYQPLTVEIIILHLFYFPKESSIKMKISKVFNLMVI